MGLTSASSGKGAIDSKNLISPCESNFIVALAGNPNVGKSTVFNGLTGMNQHTGNWPGKTVSLASGYCKSQKNSYLMVDIPGTYSLMAHSSEEEVARNFICFGGADLVIVVCDATCLERNLNLALQIIETGVKVIVCVNLIDEAKRKNIKINLSLLSERLGVPVVATIARNKKSLSRLISAVDTSFEKEANNIFHIQYDEIIENAISEIENAIKSDSFPLSKRFVALRLLEEDESFIEELKKQYSSLFTEPLIQMIKNKREELVRNNINNEKLKDMIVTSIVKSGEKICEDVILHENEKYKDKDRRLDRILTSRIFGYPVMLFMLAVVFWLTIWGANYPSEMLSRFLFMIENKLDMLFSAINIPNIITNMLVHGVYRVLAWVISVMLPPMAIFFPFFTLLEDSGYLPRIAFNLDKPFKCAGACGKQALTMCMGFGCNAAGVVGCRIIDSPRERLLAILTNSFVPCNGRFPTLIALITMFFISGNGLFSSLSSAVLLTVTVLSGILMTFAATKLLSLTILRGKPSSFTLELPPYRRPQIGKVIVRSIFDRTLFVLGRSVAFAAPAGLVIWLMANISIGDASILALSADFLDPFAKLLGLDGAILIAFILGLPANEIVIPIIIMTYISSGTLIDIADLSELRTLFISNGWTVQTALSMMIFSLFHWPCSTTLMTIKKETGSFAYTALAFLLPTVCGMLICFIMNLIFRIL